jgi:hypothetical protein
MKAGGSVKYTVPKCIASGYYLVRHEIIALHSAYTYPGAQFYPGCHQLKVTGGGSAKPAALVAFPGAYKATDAGITVDAYKGMLSVAVRKLNRLLIMCSGGVFYSGTSEIYLLDDGKAGRTRIQTVCYGFQFLYHLATSNRLPWKLPPVPFSS